MLRLQRLLVEWILDAQFLVTKLIETVSMKSVAARSRDGVQNSASGSAVLGGITGDHTLKFLNGALWHGEGEDRPLASADSAEERLIVIGAVHHHVGIDTALPREAELTACIAGGLHGWSHRGEILEPASVDREIANGFLSHHLAGSRVGDLQQRR